MKKKTNVQRETGCVVSASKVLGPSATIPFEEGA